ncbi:protein of unknown function DUF29 [Rippkaea orientalis PCC 8801]|uniref:DUF29 domain-containing protein n=1 Tax=Rippkaea orientalis (strain PCC 8801 / RF-1) TaxID=41431 RepID=B7JU98_RIPO1|nr:DUF29 domain-containing protein [Rippkaea orientalis]ACK64478.1 protein of unknown function DUF29 [Rippkaea orientalis PCC 8801]
MKTSKTNINLSQVYDLDDHLWLEETIKLLKNHQLDQLDVEHLIEELESLSRRDKAKVASLLQQIIIHCLMLQYWTNEYQYNNNHWQGEILTFRDQLNRLLTTNLNNYLLDELQNLYQTASKITAKKMGQDISLFPSQCPYRLEQLLDENWWPIQP